MNTQFVACVYGQGYLQAKAGPTWITLRLAEKEEQATRHPRRIAQAIAALWAALLPQDAGRVGIEEAAELETL